MMTMMMKREKKNKKQQQQRQQQMLNLYVWCSYTKSEKKIISMYICRYDELEEAPDKSSAFYAFHYYNCTKHETAECTVREVWNKIETAITFSLQ